MRIIVLLSLFEAWDLFIVIVNLECVTATGTAITWTRRGVESELGTERSLRESQIFSGT
jgi:hypothetical protein